MVQVHLPDNGTATRIDVPAASNDTCWMRISAARYKYTCARQSLFHLVNGYLFVAAKRHLSIGCSAGSPMAFIDSRRDFSSARNCS